MKDAARSPLKAWADRGLLIGCCLILVVPVVRMGLIVSEFATQPAVPGGTPSASATDSDPGLAERVASTRAFESWWGGRRAPYREGGDYLGVLSRHSKERSLGCVVGVMAARYRTEGVALERILIPADRVRLLDQHPGTVFELVGGETVKGKWAPISYNVAWFSDVPVVQTEYDPLITEDQMKDLELSTGLKKVARGVFVPERMPRHSGVWAVYRLPGVDTGFVFVPTDLIQEERGS